MNPDFEKESEKVKRTFSVPKTISEDIEANIEYLKTEKPVITVKDNIFKKGNLKLSEQVEKYFWSIGNSAYNEVVGDVELNKRGIKDDIAHGLGRIKSITFKAIPSVICKGKIIDYQVNWKNRGYDTVVIAAPICVKKTDDKSVSEYMAAVIIEREIKKKEQRFYLHEALAIKKDELPFKTGTDLNKSGAPGGNSSVIYSLLQKIIKDNS